MSRVVGPRGVPEDAKPARFTIEWDRDQQEWRVYDDDGMEAASFVTLLEAETYVLERDR